MDIKIQRKPHTREDYEWVLFQAVYYKYTELDNR
jgi:hypothetical protein